MLGRISRCWLFVALVLPIQGLETRSRRDRVLTCRGGEKGKVIDPRGTPLAIKAARPLAALTKRYELAVEANPKLELYVQIGSTLLSYSLSKKKTKSASTVLFARCAFVAFLLLHQLVLSFIQERIEAVNDVTPLKIPANPLVASLAAREGATKSGDITSNEAVKGVLSTMMERDTTVRDYDLELVKKGRNSQIGSLLLMAYLHLRRGYLQPLIMQTFLGFFQLLRDPLVQIYIYQRQAEDKLARPFKPPTPAWLKALEEQTKALDEQRKAIDASDDEATLDAAIGDDVDDDELEEDDGDDLDADEDDEYEDDDDDDDLEDDD